MEKDYLPKGMDINPFDNIENEKNQESILTPASLKNVNYVELIFEKLIEIEELKIKLEKLEITEDKEIGKTNLFLLLDIRKGDF